MISVWIETASCCGWPVLPSSCNMRNSCREIKNRNVAFVQDDAKTHHYPSPTPATPPTPKKKNWASSCLYFWWPPWFCSFMVEFSFLPCSSSWKHPPYTSLFFFAPDKLVSLAPKRSHLIQENLYPELEIKPSGYEDTVWLLVTLHDWPQSHLGKAESWVYSQGFLKRLQHCIYLTLLLNEFLTAPRSGKHFSSLHELFPATRGPLSITLQQRHPRPRICLPIYQVLGVQDRGQNFGFKPSNELWGNAVEEQAEWMSINTNSVGLGIRYKSQTYCHEKGYSQSTWFK